MKLWLKDGDGEIITSAWSAMTTVGGMIVSYVGNEGRDVRLDIPFSMFAQSLGVAEENKFSCLDCRRWCK